MIKDVPQTSTEINKRVSPATRCLVPRLRARRLGALEIAEGALLADIAIIFRLLIMYLPIGADFLRLLMPVIFAVLVLRRGLYVGCMSLCVAVFITAIVIGPGGVPFLLLEAGAGLFLGTTMRLRLGHFLTVALGVVCGGLALWALLLLTSLLSGGPRLILRPLHQAYAVFAPLLGLLFNFVGLANLWRQHLFPLLDGFMQWGFQNWLVLFYLAACLICVPLVIGAYFVTNFFVRLLHYDVRPFPGYRLEGLLYMLARQCLRLVPRRAFARHAGLRNLKRTVRRLNIARLRQRRRAREARKSL